MLVICILLHRFEEIMITKLVFHFFHFRCYESRTSSAYLKPNHAEVVKLFQWDFSSRFWNLFVIIFVISFPNSVNKM